MEGENRISQAEGSDSAAFHAGKGTVLAIEEESGGSLTVHAAGKGAAIGGNGWESGGTIEIRGGSVSATSSGEGAGIGGGYGGSSGNILISGGEVFAEETRILSLAASIGGGCIGSLDEITITGGTVRAKGEWGVNAIGSSFGERSGTLKITGGVVETTGGSQGCCLSAKEIFIGGDARVKASGTRGGAAVLCENFDLSGGDVVIGESSTCVRTENGTITGGALTARASLGTCLVGNYRISGGRIDAAGGDMRYESGAGIGGGDVIITGGTIRAVGGWGAAGIGGSCAQNDAKAGNITITGGSIFAVQGEGCGNAIGNGMGSTSAPAWPVNGRERVYPVVLQDVQSLEQLRIDGKPAGKLGIQEFHGKDDKSLCVYLPAGEHRIDKGNGEEIINVEEAYALALKNASAEGTQSPYPVGSQVSLKADMAYPGSMFLFWRTSGEFQRESLFSDPCAMETTLNMPREDLYIEAVYGETLTSLDILRAPDRMEYREGEPVSLQGMEVRLQKSNGDVRTVTPDQFEEEGIYAAAGEGTTLAYENHGKPLTVYYGTWSANTKETLTIHPNPRVEAEVGGVTAIPDPEDQTGCRMKAELPAGTAELPLDSSQVIIRVLYGSAGTPRTDDGGRTWRFPVTGSGGITKEYQIAVTMEEPRFELPVEVVDGKTVGPLSGVCIKAVREDGSGGEAVTGEDGRAVLKLGKGSYRISAVKEGYRLRTAKAEAGETAKPVKIPLNSSTMVEGTVKAKELSRQEIVEAGIDPDAEENRQLFRFSVNLVFQGKNHQAGGISFDYIGRTDGVPAKGGAAAQGTIENTPVTIYPISETFYLIIYGEGCWLKELFEVELAVINHSAVEEIRDCEARISLPEGLSLAAMTETPQKERAVLEAIAPGGTGRAHWYVRGDREGEFSLSVDVKGAFASEGVDPEPFHYQYEAQAPVGVRAGKAMHLTIEVEDRTWNQDDYHVSFYLENVSDRPVNDLAFCLTGEKQYRVSLIQGAKTIKTFKQEELNQRLEVPELKPGEGIRIAFKTVIEFDSQLLRDPEYVLKKAFLEILEGTTAVIPHTFIIKRGYRSARSAQYSVREYPGLKQSKAGDPVDLLTGGFLWDYQDAAVYGGEPLVYERSYRSDDEKGSRRLGKGWTGPHLR